MNPKRTMIAVAAALALAAGAGATGAAWAGDDPAAQPPPVSSSPATAPKAFLGGGIDEDSFVPISPCRLIDTRVAGGKLPVGDSRAFDVKGAGATFAAQGGKSGGCAIPNSADAIEVTITAVDAGSGFLRAWPGNLSRPDATFLNYTSAFNVSNTGTVAIDGCTAICAANNDLRLRAFGSPTHVVVDVAGYYVPPMAANIEADGNRLTTSRVVSATRLAQGDYEVEFDRDVSKCSYSATIDPSSGSGSISADPRGSKPNAVFVRAANSAGVLTDKAFYLSVVC